MIYFQFLKKKSLWIKGKSILECQSLFSFDCCWFHFFPDSTQPIPSPEPGAQREQLQTGLLWDLIQVPTAPHDAFATSLKPQISILAHADWRLGTALVSGAATGLASITTKHNHHNIIKYLIIFQVIDSEVTKSSVHISVSSLNKILLMVHPTC